MKQIAPPIFILLALFTYYVLQRFVFGARNVGLHPLCKHDSTRHHEQHQQFPLVSVIIPYGKSKRVEAVMQAIDSAVNQTYPNVEVIVVDVSGNQILQETVAATPELLLLAVNDDAEENGYQRSIRVLTVKQPNDTFAGFVRNVGVKASSGEYLAFLDSDDAYLPEKLSKHFEHAHLYDSDFEFSATEAYFSLNCRVSGNTGLFTPWNFSATASRVEEQRKQFIKYNGEKFKKGLGGTKMVRDGASLPGLWDLQLLEWHNCVITSTVILKRRVFDLVGGFNESIFREEDYDLWRRILKHPEGPDRISFLPIPLTIYDGICHGGAPTAARPPPPPPRKSRVIKTTKKTSWSR